MHGLSAPVSTRVLHAGRPRGREAYALVVGLALASCLGAPTADVDGPRVVASSLPSPRTVEVEVRPQITVELSEPLDEASLGPGALALVPWEEVGECRSDPVCARGSCERGRCLEDPLSSSDLAALLDGEYAPDGARVTLEVTLLDGELGEATRLRLQPARALTPRWRYSLILGGVRDRGGAPLVDASGRVSHWRRDLVTAHEGSSGPEPRLVEPAPGGAGVPPNLARVTTSFARPVALEATATVELEGVDGQRVALIEPRGCDGWPAAFCLTWRPEHALEPLMTYRVAGGTLRDHLGRAVAPPAVQEWFTAAEELDEEPPSLAGATVELQGPCVHARVSTAEPVVFTMSWASGAQVEVLASGELELAARVPGEDLGDAETLELSLTVRDLAGNTAEETVALDLGAADLSVPLTIAEVLGNPAGAEPGQEFIELLDVREHGDEVTISDLRVVDRPWSEVRALPADATPGDALPSFVTRPGQRTVVVGSGYVWGDPADPDPPSDAVVVTLDSSIADGGLKNAGEPLTLVRAAMAPGAPWTLIDTRRAPEEELSANGQSVISSPTPAIAFGCDRPGVWQAHPQGGSSPGSAP
ncbi:MAG: hypothetical protein H6713_21770 [Myxococcales bacterium]|nr:hypothetical protein [Myxococcales bacterium]